MSSELNPVPVVLVVEDEMVLRMRAVDIVEDAGFTPVEAVNADEAMAILESRSDIALLFTDIQMPGTMDGLRLAHDVHRRWPDIKIILVSGQVIVTEADKPQHSRFFGKPLEMKQMILQLREMMGSGVLKILPTTPPMAAQLTQVELSAENENLRHLLDQASREAQVLFLKASVDAERNNAHDRRQQLIIQEMHPTQDALTAENDSLRLALAQAGIDAKVLLVQSGIEAEERVAADTLQKLIHDELHHRIKNTLATVSAIAAQSLRTATSMEHCQQAIEGRLIALGRAHDMLMHVNWANASLDQTVRGATKPYDTDGNGCFSITGPEIKITSGAVIALAMTLNELCTNTTKFGALSVPSGRVEIEWRTDDTAQRLRLTWIEKGGPLVAPPTHRSFGTRMMWSLGQQLNGHVDLAYEPSGFTYTLDVPLATLTTKAVSATARA
ncbi:MAG: response regulator [Hyphomicrobiales bacterium]|nr:response regulator [Hyphomicrobiales bacterium]